VVDDDRLTAFDPVVDEETISQLMILHGFDGQFDIFIGATACKNQCPKQFFSWYVKVDYL